MPLVRMAARTAVVAGTATAVSNRVSRRQYNRWEGQAQQEAYEQQQAAPPPAAPPAAAPSTDDKISQLKELGQLKDSGVLTEAEFEAQKAKILAGCFTGLIAAAGLGITDDAPAAGAPFATSPAGRCDVIMA